MSDILHKIQQTLVVKKQKYNSFGRYNYRSAEDIVEGIKEVMPDGASLIMSDEMVMLGDRYYIKATVSLHHDGKFASAVGYAREALEQKGMSEGQITGSASSYARKYALCGLFAIDDGIDDDSEKGKDNAPKTFKPDAPNKAGAEKLMADIANIFEMNLANGAESFKGWWGAEESKADRAKLKALSLDDYNKLQVKYKSAVDMFIKQKGGAA